MDRTAGKMNFALWVMRIAASLLKATATQQQNNNHKRKRDSSNWQAIQWHMLTSVLLTLRMTLAANREKQLPQTGYLCHRLSPSSLIGQRC